MFNSDNNSGSQPFYGCWHNTIQNNWKKPPKSSKIWETTRFVMFGYERCVTSFWDVPGGVDGDDGLNVLEEVDLGVGSSARGRFNCQEQSLVRRDFSEKNFKQRKAENQFLFVTNI